MTPISEVSEELEEMLLIKNLDTGEKLDMRNPEQMSLL